MFSQGRNQKKNSKSYQGFAFFLRVSLRAFERILDRFGVTSVKSQVSAHRSTHGFPDHSLFPLRDVYQMLQIEPQKQNPRSRGFFERYTTWKGSKTRSFPCGSWFVNSPFKKWSHRTWEWVELRHRSFQARSFLKIGMGCIGESVSLWSDFYVVVLHSSPTQQLLINFPVHP